METINEIRENLKAHHKLFGNGIPLIASENITSPQCREACNSDFSHRYAEGVAGERVYAGCEYIDNVEIMATKMSKEYFNCNFADVRPISGVVANLAAYTAVSEPGDKMCCMPIPSGGHISHAPLKGRKSGRYIGGTAGAVHGLDVHYLKFDWEEMNLDVDASANVIREVEPRIVLFGGSVFLFPHPVKELSEVAKEVGATVLYDAAHVLGLIGSGYFQDPLREGADVMMGSTHKTFPGPQHGILLSDSEDNEFQQSLTKSCFPSMLSNHHLHNVAGLAVTLAEMKEFGKDYHAQVIKNAKKLAECLDESGFNVLCAEKGYTESHQVVADISNFEESIGLGGDIERALEKAGIIINRNLLPWDISKYKRRYTNPGGIRLGTSELTRVGMKEAEMEQVAKFMKQIIVDQKDPKDVKEAVNKFRQDFQDVHYAFPSEMSGYEYVQFD